MDEGDDVEVNIQREAPRSNVTYTVLSLGKSESVKEEFTDIKQAAMFFSKIPVEKRPFVVRTERSENGKEVVRIIVKTIQIPDKVVIDNWRTKP